MRGCARAAAARGRGLREHLQSSSRQLGHDQAASQSTARLRIVGAQLQRVLISPHRLIGPAPRQQPQARHQRQCCKALGVAAGRAFDHAQRVPCIENQVAWRPLQRLQHQRQQRGRAARDATLPSRRTPAPAEARQRRVGRSSFARKRERAKARKGMGNQPSYLAIISVDHPLDAERVLAEVEQEAHSLSGRPKVPALSCKKKAYAPAPASRITRTWLADTLARCSTLPLGQRTSTRSARVRSPRPNRATCSSSEQ